MKAKDFLMIEQETIQVLPPFDIEVIKQEFGKKVVEFEYSGITVGDVKFTPEGTTLVLQQGNTSSEVTFSYSDDVGPFAAVKPSNTEHVNLDLTPMNPPVVDSSGLGKQIDLQNLTWLSKEGFEAIMAASQIKEAPEETPPEELPSGMGSDGSGASIPSSQQPLSPPVELDAKTVPAPSPRASVPLEIPGESLKEEQKIFKVNEYSSGFEVEHIATGETAWMGDGVDVFDDMTPGDPGFVERWEDDLNSNPDETLEAYFPELYDRQTEGKKKEQKSKTPDLDAPTQHQIDIAKKTVKMPDAILGVMGGMTKEQAKEILKKYGVEKDKEETFNQKALPGIKLEAMYRVTFKKDKDTGVVDIDASSETDALTKAKQKLRTDQKILSVGKPPKSESKGLTYFRFIIREGKRIKIPVGVTSALIETKKKKDKQINKVVSGKKFKPGQFWHSAKKEGLEEQRFGRPQTDAERKKLHLAKFGFSELPPCGTGRVKERRYYDDEEISCPVCKEITGKVNPDCKRCKGKGVITENKNYNTQFYTIVREGKKIQIPIHEQQVTKKFFIAMANAIKNMPDQISKKELVDEMVRIFQSENPRFDSGRFRLACGA